jgi:hypothetical protein
MSKEKLRELYRVDRHACQNSRSAQASARSPNRTTSSSYTVASARLSVLDPSALSRPLKEREKTDASRTRSISKVSGARPAVARPLKRRRRTAFISLFYQQPPDRRRARAQSGSEPRRVRRFH